MRRRTFLAFTASVATAWPFVARSQQMMPLIGFLGGADPVGYAVPIEALRAGFRDHGYVEGENIRIEYRWAEGRYERLPALAADLVSRKVSIIITQGTPAALAAKQATTTIPIVMAIVGDPVPTVVPSYSRPGGNITGSSFFFHEINAKRLELLKELIPTLESAGVLMNSDNPAMASVLRAMEETAKAKDIRLRHIAVRGVDELDASFQQTKGQIQGFTVLEDGFLFANAKRIAELAIRNRLPSMGFREICDAGGLAAYAVDYRQIFRRAAVFVDKIIKGSKPVDLPIEQATRFELIINMRTANTLGLTIPPALLARADEVIE